MNTKKIALYDSQKHFYRCFKGELSKSFEFDFFSDFKCFEDAIYAYSTILFVVFNEDGIADLMSIYKKEVTIIVCSSSEKLLLKMENIEEILFLNTSEIKTEIIPKMRLYLNSVNKYNVELTQEEININK
jgi:hypothetical protein